MELIHKVIKSKNIRIDSSERQKAFTRFTRICWKSIIPCCEDLNNDVTCLKTLSPQDKLPQQNFRKVQTAQQEGANSRPHGGKGLVSIWTKIPTVGTEITAYTHASPSSGNFSLDTWDLRCTQWYLQKNDSGSPPPRRPEEED